jgi:hypothetical protein
MRVKAPTSERMVELHPKAEHERGVAEPSPLNGKQRKGEEG